MLVSSIGALILIDVSLFAGDSYRQAKDRLIIPPMPGQFQGPTMDGTGTWQKGTAGILISQDTYYTTLYVESDLAP